MSNIPALSLIIPVYNVEAYLRQCLDSVLSQTLENIEVICINDGSTDNSLKILREYARRDHRVLVISQTNHGVATARNIGIKKARGEFIAFIDSDDFYPDNDTLDLVYQTAKKHHAFICGGSLCYFKKNKLITSPIEMEKGYYFLEDGYINYVDYQFDYGFGRFIYQRDFILKNKLFFPNYQRGEDPVFFIKAMCLAQKFYALHKPTYVYRIGYKKVCWSEAKILNTLKSLEASLKLCQQNGLNILAQTIEYRIAKFQKKLAKSRSFWHKILFWKH